MTREDVKNILSIEGEIRGKMSHVVKVFKKVYGEEKVKKIEKLLEKLGYPMSQKDLDKIRFYKMGEMMLYLMAAKEVLGLSNKQFEEVGRMVGKNLILIKYLSPFFKLDRKFFFEKIPQFSSRFFKGLKLAPLEVNLQEKRSRFKISGLKMDKSRKIIRDAQEIGISYFSGVLASWAQMVLGSEKVRCEIFQEKEDEYIFTITWQ